MENMRRFREFRHRKVIMMIADIFILAMVGIVCYMVMSFFSVYSDYNKRVLLAALITIFISYVLLLSSGVYDIRWRHMNPKNYIHCGVCILFGCFFSFIVMHILNKNFGIWFWLGMSAGSVLGCLLFRFLFRNAFLYMEENGCRPFQKRTLIVGAGEAAKMLLTEMNTRTEQIPYYPVCLVDDDKMKQRTYLKDVPIKGCIEDLPALCKNENIDVIMLAIPSLRENERKRILDICAETSCELKVIPYLTELIENNETSLLGQVKDIRMEELLGRDPVTFDSKELLHFVSGKVVMVTGGGGSIGSELCRQIVKYNPKQLIILDIYENNAYEIQQELFMEYGSSLEIVTLISSVRDVNKMELIFSRYRPNIVFHAAAHKHVPLMETVPEEAVKNNVMGTYHCASLANRYGVDKFVMISTDKAVNPTNVMGATKRCCEMIIQYMSQTHSHTEYVAVRFGNVLGSNGSVIPLFKKQIEAGKALTVTHPDIIRYFMTIPEAVSLVLQAGAMAKGGEIFVLDMGEPVKIVTLAENLIRMYGKKPYKDVSIHFTGLRPGEKLYEELLMDEEGLQSTPNHKIFIGHQIAINTETFLHDLEALNRAAEDNDSDETVKRLTELVPTFQHEMCRIG